MWTFGATIASISVSLVIKYTKHYKYFVIIGSCIYLMGLISMVLYRVEGASTTALAGTTALVGMGGGMLNVPAQLGVQASASHQEVAAATAIFLTFLEIGGAVGSAISGAIWTANVPMKLALYLPPETKDQAREIYSNITLASTGWPMDDPTRIAINRAYQETMTKILTVAVCVAIPVVVLSFFMKDYELDKMDQHVKGTVIGGQQQDAVVPEPEEGDEVYDDQEPQYDSRVSIDSARAEEEPMLRQTWRGRAGGGKATRGS